MFERARIVAGVDHIGLLFVVAILGWSGGVCSQTAPPVGDIERSIREAEYNITRQAQTVMPNLGAAWHATNRAQNLRFYFTGDECPCRRSDCQRGAPELLRLRVVDSLAPAQRPAVLESVGKELAVRRAGLTERFVHTERGLEHLVIVDDPPPNGELLALEIESSSAGLTMGTESVGVSEYHRTSADLLF